MIRPLVVREISTAWIVVVVALLGGLGIGIGPRPTRADAPATTPEVNPGQFFTITEPITNEVTSHIRAATKEGWAA